MKRIDGWEEMNIPELLMESFGIKELYPPQRDALPLALSGKSLVLSMATAGGKSLIGYGAILKKALSGKKAIYIVPLRALAREKYEDLKVFEKFNVRVGISTGDYEDSPERLGRYDILVCTSEKADSIIRHDPGWLSGVDVVVADEIHLINDPDRGPTLEVTLAELKLINPQIQIIALSATIPNSIELAGWLGAEHIESDFRPVLLREGVYFDDSIYFSDGETRRIEKRSDELFSLILEGFYNGSQVIVFVNTRKRSENLALKISRILPEGRNRELEEAAHSLEVEESKGKKLSECVRKGAAFHHAGLTEDQRRIVEKQFKGRQIKCIFATPTLAAGINLPAKMVIVRDMYRYAGGFYAPLSVMEVKQMLGRAGRPGYDRMGEAVIFARNYNDMQRIIEGYIEGDSEPVESKLGAENALRTHVLSSIANGFVSDMGSMENFLLKTFYGSTRGIKRERLQEISDFLRRAELIGGNEKIRATKFGSLTSKLYIDPLSAMRIRTALEGSEMKSDFAYLHLIASLPDMRKLYMNKSDLELLGPFAEGADIFLEDGKDDFDWFMREIKTACVMRDWIEEVREQDVIEKYRVDPGDIRALVEIAEWLCRACAQIARLFNGKHVRKLDTLETRLRFGIRGELLELTRIKGVGRKRARILYRSGYIRLEDVAKADYGNIVKLEGMGEKLARAIIENAREIWKQ